MQQPREFPNEGGAVEEGADHVGAAAGRLREDEAAHAHDQAAEGRPTHRVQPEPAKASSAPYTALVRTMDKKPARAPHKMQLRRPAGPMNRECTGTGKSGLTPIRYRLAAAHREELRASGVALI